MNDQYYIKTGVELADGWEWNHGGAFCDAIGRDLIFGRDRVAPKPWMLAAIASQLLDQMDATDFAWVDISSGGLVRIFAGDGDKEVATQFGPDRRMNIIKAVVDSKVLK